MRTHFRVNIVIRVCLIIILSVTLSFVLLNKPMLFTPIVLSICIGITSINLIRYIEKSNRDLTHLLLSLKQTAFTDTFGQGNRGKNYNDFSNALNEITSEFAKLSLEKELHYQYLVALNENIGVCILSFNNNGNLLHSNRAAKNLLGNRISSTNDLKLIDEGIYKAVERREVGRSVVKTVIRDEQMYLSVQIKEIKMQKEDIRIVLLQNIHDELENKETEAWQQLTRVLTHEIMNSVTPIASLTKALNKILINADDTIIELSKLDDDQVKDVQASLATVISRADGLIKFVSAYRELAFTPQLRFEKVELVGLIQRILDLFSLDFKASSIQCNFHTTTSSFYATADGAAVEQVIVNLIKNAIEATAPQGGGMIDITLKKTGGDCNIVVADSGSGIDPDMLNKIFVPFFTTKSKGSGIGLSLSRQIMKLHNGSIRVLAKPLQGSVFLVSWPY